MPGVFGKGLCEILMMILPQGPISDCILREQWSINTLILKIPYRIEGGQTQIISMPLLQTPSSPDLGMQESISMFYNELWFIILMAGLGLVLLAIFLGLLLHKALKSSPFARERPPLVPLPLQKRSPMGAYPPSDSYLFDTVPDISNTSSSVTLKGFTFHMERVTENKVVTSSDAHDPNRMLSLQGQQSHTHFQNSLHRSVSQLIDTQDSKFLKDDGIWSPVIWGHDSGLFMDDEVFEDTIKGFSTVRKEHTMFTDTNL